jgi:histidine triad (HIT) family protein
MASIFSKIIEGSIPCYKIVENDYAFAFLDINPLAEGHTLVVPKMEVDLIYDLPSEHYLQLFALSQQIAKALKEAVTCNRIGLAVVGLEVPHAHVHLIPIQTQDDINFSRSRIQLSSSQFSTVVERIQKQLIDLKS